MNLIVKLAKNPVRDWVSLPLADQTQSQQQDGKQNEQQDEANSSRAAINALLKASGSLFSSAGRGGGGKGETPAPGHGSGVVGERNSAGDDGVPSLVYELD